MAKSLARERGLRNRTPRYYTRVGYSFGHSLNVNTVKTLGIRYSSQVRSALEQELKKSMVKPLRLSKRPYNSKLAFLNTSSLGRVAPLGLG